MDYCEYPCDDIPNPNSNITVTYYPNDYNSFIYKSTNEPIYSAKEVVLANLRDKIFVTKE